MAMVRRIWFTMRDAIKIAGSCAVRASELQANTKPSDLPVCPP